jgi:LTXXQ motif family protein
MRKLILTAIAAAGIAGSTFAYTAYAANEPPNAAHVQQMQEERAAMLDAHLAGFKAGLKLTADQEKMWAPFESAIRGAAKERGEAMMKMHEMMGGKDGAKPSAIDHMLTMSDEMGKMSSELKIVADAGKPLYDSLNDMQKRNFGPLLHDLMPRHGHGGHMGGRGPGDDGEGPGEMQ